MRREARFADDVVGRESTALACRNQKCPQALIRVVRGRTFIRGSFAVAPFDWLKLAGARNDSCAEAASAFDPPSVLNMFDGLSRATGATAVSDFLFSTEWIPRVCAQRRAAAAVSCL